MRITATDEKSLFLAFDSAKINLTTKFGIFEAHGTGYYFPFQEDYISINMTQSFQEIDGIFFSYKEIYNYDFSNGGEFYLIGINEDSEMQIQVFRVFGDDVTSV